MAFVAAIDLISQLSGNHSVGSAASVQMDTVAFRPRPNVFSWPPEMNHREHPMRLSTTTS